MTLLCLDTAQSDLLLALYHPETGETHRFDPQSMPTLTAPNQHASVFFPALVSLLDAAGVSPQALTGVAINTGPGSFTGLRVGLTVANMLQAFAPDAFFETAKRATYVFNTFELLAAQSRYRERRLRIILDAYRGRYFMASLTVAASGLVTWHETPKRYEGTELDTDGLALEDVLIVQTSLLSRLNLSHLSHGSMTSLISLDEALEDTLAAMIFLLTTQPEHYQQTGGIQPNYMQQPHITLSKAAQAILDQP